MKYPTTSMHHQRSNSQLLLHALYANQGRIEAVASICSEATDALILALAKYPHICFRSVVSKRKAQDVNIGLHPCTLDVVQ